MMICRFSSILKMGIKFNLGVAFADEGMVDYF